VGRCSVVGIATGWAVRRSNPGGGREIFRIGPDRHSGTPSLLYNGYRVFPGGKERPERDADPSPLSSAVGHERVELYLYFPVGRTACTEPQCLYKGALYLYSRAIPLLPCGPYGLYKASVPVQGCTLPFFCVHALRPVSIPGYYFLCKAVTRFTIFKFKVCKSVHRHTIKLNQPTRRNNYSSLLLDVYVQFNMFRASLRPSSGAQQLQ